ncbi:MAG: type II secretion system F family protein [Candidatus Omnitrophica bacterium]|jgi:general secretion pathway protein F|nr:type II secretion system F family protein [Candidatus Omnitrophota bacterium]
MPEFEYVAKDGPTRQVQGVVEAPNETEAVDLISRKGYLPVRVWPKTSVSQARSAAAREKSAKASESARWIGGRGRREKQVIAFSRHLSAFLKNQIPVLKALEIIRDETHDARFRSVLETLHKDLKEGRTLSAAIEKHPQYFSQVFVAMVRSGENGSVLQETLLILSDYQKKQERLRGTVRQALIYPVFLMGAGLLTVLFILTFVVPRLTLLFNNMGQTLPLPTRIVIAAGNAMRYGWPVVLFLAYGIGVWLPRRVRHILGAETWDRMRAGWPIVGPLLFKSELARFCRALHMSMTNGVPFLQGLEVAIPIVNLAHLRAAFLDAAARVRTGAFFGQSLRQTNVFPALVTDMIVVGEESGNLQDLLAEIAQVYEEEVDDHVRIFTALLEPTMIVLVGGVVGFVVLAMLMPIFEMDVLK